MEFFSRLVIGLTLLVHLQSCMSIYTMTTDPKEFEFSEEDCESGRMFIPRIYSGTLVDLFGVLAPEGGQGSAILFYDLFLSFPVDTLALPYTIYGQIRHGNLSSCPQEGNTADKQLIKDENN